uniref:5'-deoxynucleotidase HDDC2 n=1 Tax=Amblyomma aureolatum TaxID=187763 RepID=A0A1E1X132_9ACAR
MASAAVNALSYFMLIGKLKGIRRTGWVLRDVPDPERVSGHMYRMSVMAMMLGNDPDAGVNKDKCIRMALVHDMGECIVGDITPMCGVSKEEKFRRESEAMNCLAKLVDNVSAAEFKSLWEEYEAQNSPESKVVKDLDMFDMILQAHEYEVEMQDPGRLQEFFDSTNGRFQHRIVKQWTEELYKLRASHLSQGEK